MIIFFQISNWNTCSDKYRYMHGANQEGYANSALPWKIQNVFSAIVVHGLMKVENKLNFLNLFMSEKLHQ